MFKLLVKCQFCRRAAVRAAPRTASAAPRGACPARAAQPSCRGASGKREQHLVLDQIAHRHLLRAPRCYSGPSAVSGSASISACVAASSSVASTRAANARARPGSAGTPAAACRRLAARAPGARARRGRPAPRTRAFPRRRATRRASAGNRAPAKYPADLRRPPQTRSRRSELPGCCDMRARMISFAKNRVKTKSCLSPGAFVLASTSRYRQELLGAPRPALRDAPTLRVDERGAARRSAGGHRGAAR